MPGRVVTITALGNVHDLEASFRRAGLVVSDSADTMANAAKRAGATAAASAKEAGAATDAQAAAAGRAAAAVVDAEAKMSRAQKAASAAAAAAAKTAGESADAQIAAAKRAADAQKAAEDEQIAAAKRTADAQIAEAKRAADEQVATAKRTADAAKKHKEAHATVSKVGGVVALGAVGATVEAVKLGEQFQTAQASIQGATGQSVKETSKLTGAFQSLGTGASATVGSGQQMEAAYAGVAGQLKLTEGRALSVAEATKFSDAANHLAEASGEGLASAYSATSQVLQTYHMPASQAAQVTDTLYSTSKALKTPVEQVATAVSKLRAHLGEATPSLGDTAGLMVALGEHGLTGSRGLLVVNTAFQTLLGGSKKTEEVLKAVGVSVYDSSGKFVGLRSVISQLQPKLAGMTEQQRRYVEATLFGKGATEVMGQVVRAGVPAFQQATDAATRHGAALKASEPQSKTFHNEMEAVKHTVETLGGSLGQILIPDLQKAATGLSEGTQWLEKHKAAATALAGVVTTVLGTAVAVYAYDKSVKFVQGTKRMIDGLGGVGKKILETTGIIESQGAAQAAAVEANAAKMEASNATAGASFKAVGTDAAAGEAATVGAVEGEATAVGTADGAIAGENAAAGASFKALAGGAIKYLGMIGLAFVAAEGAAHAFGAALSAITGEHQPESLGELFGGSQPGEKRIAEADKRAGQWGNSRNARGEGQLGQSNQFPFVAEVASRYGVSPNTLWGIYGTETTYGKNITTSKTGAQGAFQFEPETAKTYGYPLTNHPNRQQFQAQAEAAARYIAVNTRKYGSEAKAVEAYYGGKPGGQSEYLHKVEAAGGAHYGKAQEEEAKKAQEAIQHAQSGNKAIQELLEEASGKKKKKAKVEPYVDPLAEAHGVHVGRIDEGRDYSATPGSRINAIGAGVVDSIIKNWYKGQPLIEETFTEGARKGQHVYYAEQITPGVREGEHVKAGQQIGTVAASGTGLEIGFGAGGGRTLAQATTGYKEGEVTKAGQEFSKFIASIGKGGTVTSVATKAQEAIEKAEAKRMASLEAAAKRLKGEGAQRGDFQSVNQSGSVAQLEKILGVSTGGATGKRLAGELQGELTQAHLEHTIMPTLSKSAQASGAGKEFDKLIAELKAVHTAAANKMVASLEQAHRQALANLGRELYAVTQEKQGALASNQATEEKDRTTLASNLAARQLDIVKAEAARQTDAMQAATKQIDDASQQMKDAFAEAVEAIQDATQKMSDVASGEVQHTQDQTATKVAELGERGKYGLELVAQKLEVQLDQMKAAYDIQIQEAKISLDNVKIAEQQLIAQKQQGMDLLQAHEDQLAAAAQERADNAAVTNAITLSTAQGTMDAIQLAADQHVDAALIASVLVATSTKARQDAAKGFETELKGKEAFGVAGAEHALHAAESAASAAVEAAKTAYAVAQSEGEKAISEAQRSLAKTEGEAHERIANAEQGLASIESTAKVAESALEGKIAIERERAATQYAGSGMVVNFTNIPPTDAAAISSELGWLGRSLIPA